MPWRPLVEICREVEQLPLRLTPTDATEMTGVFARRLGINPSEISRAALLEAARLAVHQSLETVMRYAALEMKWLASGRRSVGGKREVIRPDHWAFLTLDIELQVVRDLDGKVVYVDVKGAFGNDLTEEEWQSVEHQLAPPSPVIKKEVEQPDTTTVGGDQGKAAELPEPTDPAPSAVRPNRRGRKPGQAPFARSDKLLIKEMHKLVGDDEEEASVLSAAQQFAGQAKGAGTLESKVDRLRKRYREEHPLKEL